jgi:hypothetical protein
MSQVIADREPAHHRRPGTGENGRTNRGGRSEFELMSGRRLIAVHRLVAT